MIVCVDAVLCNVITKGLQKQYDIHNLDNDTSPHVWLYIEGEVMWYCQADDDITAV